MGEVYKAEDLKLGQQVALKFLPNSLSNDSAALARFHREVRMARQIAHANVCRVFDIGEMDGLHFISMEYIDGEDLSILLRRIGHLPSQKALQIARQLCAGLSAAHETGVLHRDLKPGNIMLDGRGKVRIMDFGLAGLINNIKGKEIYAGTPGYMAPEQLTGKEVSIKSDLYSLGLVLYEVFTGKRVHEAQSLKELLRQHETSNPSKPSELIKDIDPIVEAVILRCLEKNPANRPASALQVAAALPGGDPIAMALAAGETPSPEMVAAAPKQGALRPSVATMCLLGLLCVLVFILTADSAKLYRRIQMTKSTEILKERATSMAQQFGYTNQIDSSSGLDVEATYYSFAQKDPTFDNSSRTLQSGQPIVAYFWYRQSPQYLSPINEIRVSQENPPNVVPGMVYIVTDVKGRLVKLQAVPRIIENQNKSDISKTDWASVFKLAGLDISKFNPTVSKWTPPTYADERKAWNGRFADHPSIPIRIEAASYLGHPVYFEVVPPWQKDRSYDDALTSRQLTAVVLLLIAFIFILIGTILLATRNLRSGRGDRKGAFRVAVFLFVTMFVGAIIQAHHIPSLSAEFNIFVQSAQYALICSFLLWLIYIALEPYVRRKWPSLIISWSRLLAGNFRDPMVGRDILIGGVLGVAHASAIYIANLPILTGNNPDTTGLFADARSFGSMRQLIGDFALSVIPESILLGSMLLLFFLLLNALLRKKYLAIAALFSLDLIVILLFFGRLSFGNIIGILIIATAVTIAVVRFGLLAAIAMQLFFGLSFSYPLTSDFSIWYSSNSIFALTLILIIAGYGFYVSLGGQPFFRNSFLQEE
jgi:serine/threonine-protein kinase